MKNLRKVLSLVLALVCVLSMSVVVNAGKTSTVTPYITGSVEQTDIYERTVTIKVYDVEDTAMIVVTKANGHTADSKEVHGTKSATISYTFTYEVATNTKNYNSYYEVKCYADKSCKKLLNSKKVYVGSNEYFDIDAKYNSGNTNPGSYDGIITPSKSSPSVIDSTPYDPTKWNGYKDEYIGIFTVKCNKLNVRAGMTTKAKKVGSLKKGTNVCVYALEDGWAKIIYEGQYCYVSAKYLKSL